MNDNQIKYDDLVSEIYARKNLDEKDRMLFYRLHKEVASRDVSAMDSLISELRNQKKYNEHYILSRDERMEIVKILDDKRLLGEGLNRYEYRYLNFLSWKYGIKSTASYPCFPEIIEITLNDFKLGFAFNTERMKIYGIFLKGLARCLELYKLDEIEILVGGSYTDKDIPFPNDIDPLIVLPKLQWQDDRNHSILNAIIKEFQRPDRKNIFDLHKMPVGLSDDHYMVYELLTLMGNQPEFKIENGIRNMKFKCRDIFRLKLKPGDISTNN